MKTRRLGFRLKTNIVHLLEGEPLQEFNSRPRLKARFEFYRAQVVLVARRFTSEDVTLYDLEDFVDEIHAFAVERKCFYEAYLDALTDEGTRKHAAEAAVVWAMTGINAYATDLEERIRKAVRQELQELKEK